MLDAIALIGARLLMLLLRGSAAVNQSSDPTAPRRATSYKLQSQAVDLSRLHTCCVTLRNPAHPRNTEPCGTSPDRTNAPIRDHILSRSRAGGRRHSVIVRRIVLRANAADARPRRAVSLSLRHDEVHRLQVLRGRVQRTEWQSCRHPLETRR